VANSFGSLLSFSLIFLLGHFDKSLKLEAEEDFSQKELERLEEVLDGEDTKKEQTETRRRNDREDERAREDQVLKL